MIVLSVASGKEPINAMDARASTLDKEEKRLVEAWTEVLPSRPREFTLAIFWGEDPMVLTYTTLRTLPDDANGHAPFPPSVEPPSHISVALVEPNRFFLPPLVEWVNALEGCNCIGAFTNADEAIQGFKSCAFDLVLLDRQLADQQAEKLTAALREVAAYVPVLGYRIYDSSDELFVSQPRVAGGYYFRRRLPKDLLEPVRDAWNRKPPGPAEWRARIYGYIHRLFRSPIVPGISKSQLPLTNRERDILSCLCQGIPDKEIAQTLNISAWTVHTHLKRIYEKLGVHSRSEAILALLQ